MSDQQVDNVRAFKYVTRLDCPSQEQIYRLLYADTTRYLCVDLRTSHLYLLDRNGEQIFTELRPLFNKVRAYERVAGGALDREGLGRFMRIDEARYLINELLITDPQLEEYLYHRLRVHVDRQVAKRFYSPLLLPKLLEHNEFVYNYLQTNIGHPDRSENYFNKLREMIQQITEQTDAIAVPSYRLVLQSLLKYADLRSSAPTVAVQSYQSYTILWSGFDLLSDRYHHFTRDYQSLPSRDTTDIFALNNAMINDVVRIYNHIRF